MVNSDAPSPTALPTAPPAAPPTQAEQPPAVASEPVPDVKPLVTPTESQSPPVEASPPVPEIRDNAPIDAATPEAKPEVPEVKPDVPDVKTEVPEAKPEEIKEKLSDAATKALLLAAKALKITETDVDKLPELIEVANARIEQQEAETAAQQAEAAAAAANAARDDFKNKVGLEWIQANSPIIDLPVLNAMAAEGWDVASRPEGQDPWWSDPTPIDDGTGRTYGQVATERFRQLKVAELEKPNWNELYKPYLDSKLAEYNANQERIQSLGTKYPDYSKELVSNLRKFDASPELIEDVARLTDETVKQRVATINSTLAAANTRIAEMEAAISGHAQAIAKAKTDGYAEGQNQAMSRIIAGDRLPNTIGVAPPAADQVNSYTPNGRISLDRIPLAGSRK
jgi:flagellar biosynthesis/type III secretory pathway protein FliH